MSKKPKLVIVTAKEYKTSLAKVVSALAKYDAKNASSLISWHEETLPVINALIKCVASNRKEISKKAKFKLSTDANIASSALPKVNVDLKVLRQAQQVHARRIKTLSTLLKNGVEDYLNG